MRARVPSNEGRRSRLVRIIKNKRRLLPRLAQQQKPTALHGQENAMTSKRMMLGNLRFIRSGEEEKDGGGMLKMASEVSLFYLPTNI
jgi:hypothetical protein